MKIYLVRHGETDSNYKGLIQGRSNGELDDNGRRQARLLRMRLNSVKFDVCYTSSLVRCFETAFIIIGDKCPMIKDDRLIERDMGELEGRDFREYNAYKYWDYNMNCTDRNIEGVVSVFDRCHNFLDYIKSKYDDNTNILVVTHGAPYRALRYLIKGAKLEGHMFDGTIKNCQCEVFNI